MSDFDSHFPLKKTRTHEVCGPSAHAFAFALAGQIYARSGGTVLWIRQAWQGAQLNPLGFAGYLDPQHVLVAQAPSHMDVLACAEEALRSGHIMLVVTELAQPIGLTEGRRLQLAAQEGETTGLCIVPTGMGSNAAQSRWHCAPLFDENAQETDSTLQHWEIIKNKSGTLKAWAVKWDAQTCRINVVSEAAQR